MNCFKIYEIEPHLENTWHIMFLPPSLRKHTNMVDSPCVPLPACILTFPSRRNYYPEFGIYHSYVFLYTFPKYVFCHKKHTIYLTCFPAWYIYSKHLQLLWLLNRLIGIALVHSFHWYIVLHCMNAPQFINFLLMGN